MKKNKMMRAAAGLMIATLLTTSVISGTFAKYVTSADATDSARVAKFGVEITANGTMFATAYNTDDTTITGISQSVISSSSSDSNDVKNVVAPGTSGDLVESTITGTPEVAVNVKRVATLELNGWSSKQDKNADASYYCPIVITVNNTEYYGLDYANETAFKNAVEAAINADNKNYEPKTDLSSKKTDTLDVKWKWAFEGGNGESVNRTDYADTYLGDQAATATAASISLKVVTTVTQID